MRSPGMISSISIHAPRMGSDRVRPRCRGLLGDFNPRSPDGERPCVLAWQPPCLRISIHAPRMGSDPLWYTRLSPCSYFNPRSPDGERLVPRVRRPENGISIHAPRMGSDCPAFVTMRRTLTFQSTLPGWGATAPALVARNSWPDISIHAPRMGSDLVRVEHVRVGFHISIHAPRMGSDLPDLRRNPSFGFISIHAPRMGSDECDEGGRRCRIYFNPRSPDGERRADKLQSIRPCAFQSTLPGWGATVSGRIDHVAVDYFNPRSPDGERRTGQQDRHRQTDFNPRSPDGERHGAAGLAHPRTDFNPRSPDGERPVTVPPWPIVPIFQSTLPGWGATYTAVCLGVSPYISIHAPRMGSDGHHGPLHQQPRKISIHAPRMGSDYSGDASLRIMLNFNPRSPDGERRCRRTPRTGGGNFNPRSPDGERLCVLPRPLPCEYISIHAPRMGSDQINKAMSDLRAISIHAPRMGSDDSLPRIHRRKPISIHAPRMGSDKTTKRIAELEKEFQSTLPGWGAT